MLLNYCDDNCSITKIKYAKSIPSIYSCCKTYLSDLTDSSQDLSAEKNGVTSPAFSSPSVLIQTFSVSIIVWRKIIILAYWLINYMNIATSNVTGFAPYVKIIYN